MEISRLSLMGFFTKRIESEEKAQRGYMLQSDQ